MTDFLNKDVPVSNGVEINGGVLYPWLVVKAGGGTSEFSEIRMRGSLYDKNGNEILDADLPEADALINTLHCTQNLLSLDLTPDDNGKVTFLASGDVPVADPTTAIKVRINKNTKQGVLNNVLEDYVPDTRLAVRQKLTTGVTNPAVAYFTITSFALDGTTYLQYLIGDVDVAPSTTWSEDDEIILDKYVPSNLKELTDVDLTVDPVDSQFLVFDGGDSKWKAGNPVNTTLTDNASATTLITDGSGPTLSIKSVDVSDGVQLSDAGGTVTFSSLRKANGGIDIEFGALALNLGQSAITGVLTVPNGGTGNAVIGLNALLLGNGTSAMSQLGTTASKVLTSSVGGVPQWGDVNLASQVTGVLPIANGGTGTNESKAYATGEYASTVVCTLTSTDYKVPFTDATIKQNFSYNGTSNIFNYTGVVTKNFKVTVSSSNYQSTADSRCIMYIAKNGANITAKPLINYSKNSTTYAENTASISHVVQLSTGQSIGVNIQALEDAGITVTFTSFEIIITEV